MRSFRVLWLPIELAFRADVRRALVVPALAVATGLGGVLHGLGLKWLVDSAVAGVTETTLTAAAVLACSVTLTHVVGTAGARVRMTFQQKVGFVLDQRVLRMCAGIPVIAHYENPEYLDRIEVLRSTRGQIGATYGGLVQGLRGVVQLGGILTLLATVDPWLLLLPICVAPATLTTAMGERAIRRQEDEVAPTVRARDALLDLATSVSASKELRVHGLAGELAARHDEVLAGIHRSRRQAERSAAWWTTAGRLAFTTGFLAAVSLVAVRSVQGVAGPGDVALVLVLAGQLDGTLSAVIGLYAAIQRSSHAARQYFWLTDFAAGEARSPGASGTAVAGGDIVLNHVTFHYPGSDRPVLRDISLRLTAGSVVAIVGENGAGKSSLVKLLCGLYLPSTGTIAYTRDSGASWQRRLSAGFQDFCRFELIARESVGVGDLPSADDDIAVRSALARVGADKLADDLPNGLDTQLGRSFDGGVDLSTGQWQSMALGRSAMRVDPILRVLDEPTASLDPEAEHALFTRYAELARRPGHSTITVMVSHRFSTVREADLIVVLEQGRLTEMGNHDELMDGDGRYAELYCLQARGYR